MTHQALPALSEAAGRAEIQTATRLLRAATGRDPGPLFRFPYGSRDARTLALVHSLGYVSVRWTVDTLGWMGESPGGIVNRVLKGLQPGEIVMMHLGATTDARALPTVIAAIRARGYRFVTLAGVHGAATKPLLVYGTNEIHVVDANGHDRTLTSTPGGESLAPAWSPDGRWIAFVRATGL